MNRNYNQQPYITSMISGYYDETIYNDNDSYELLEKVIHNKKLLKHLEKKYTARSNQWNINLDQGGVDVEWKENEMNSYGELINYMKMLFYISVKYDLHLDGSATCPWQKGYKGILIAYITPLNVSVIDLRTSIYESNDDPVTTDNLKNNISSITIITEDDILKDIDADIEANIDFD